VLIGLPDPAMIAAHTDVKRWRWMGECAVTEQSGVREEARAGAEVVEAVQRVFRDGLLSGKSAFAQELDAWSERTVSDLRARIRGSPG
jgi:hypothetical protein